MGVTRPVTIGDVLQWLTERGSRPEPTVDELMFGSEETEVTGIVTTFVAAQHVLEQAAGLGANLVISHEGIFYSHHERQDTLQDDPVYRTKREWLVQSGIAVYRFHDHVHRYEPDAITEGLVRDLGWAPYVDERLPAATIVRIPDTSVTSIAEAVKTKLGIPYVRAVGDTAASCSRIGLLAGYRGGGSTAIPLFESRKLDLIIAGEGPEWETPEYVRDAVHQGRRKSLLLIGHAASEEPGMRYVAGLLGERFPGVPVRFIPAKPLFELL
ncbi:Nif3-like dinuclear metal center hexameric protein [Paenibacillus chartarius]|uniref:GTP cyclohydrolase 1 type 2 homolog n=1 Tax=Paenibacillus chartarius TaxID=747481 RepID=A0ABV6DPK8_9BACL